MEMFIDAGIFAVFSLVAFVAGLILTVRAKDPARVSTALAGLILALGLMGAGLGQGLVDNYIGQVEPLDKKVAILSAGTREATGNHVLSGGMAALLLALGAAMSRSRRDD